MTLKWWKVELNGRKWGAIVMLMGEYNHTIDAKGRLIVPAKFREVLGDEFVVTKGLDNCLFVYPNDEWQKFEEKLQTLPLTNKNARQFARFFVAGATPCELDKQGRILLPATLREFAGLEKDVVLTGMLNRIEIWSKEKWTRFFLAGAASVEVDKQGRILLPSVLREFAGLEKDVVLVGVASRIEIWSKDRWLQSISTYDDDMDEVAANMESLGFSI